MIQCVYSGGYRASDITIYHNEMVSLPPEREAYLLHRFPQWFILVPDIQETQTPTVVPDEHIVQKPIRKNRYKTK